MDPRTVTLRYRLSDRGLTTVPSDEPLDAVQARVFAADQLPAGLRDAARRYETIGDCCPPELLPVLHRLAPAETVLAAWIDWEVAQIRTPDRPPART